jgi:hypothetical protein
MPFLTTSTYLKDKMKSYAAFQKSNIMTFKKYWVSDDLWRSKKCFVSLIKLKSQGKAIEVTVNNKEKTHKTFVWILSKNSPSGPVQPSRIWTTRPTSYAKL